MWKLALCLAGVGVVVGALSVGGSTGWARATRPADVAADPPPAPRAREVKFPTQDNLVIAGDYYPSSAGDAGEAPIAILLHMYHSNRSAYRPLVPHLHAAGFAVLAIDLRGHGGSVGLPAMGLARRVAERDPRLFADMGKDIEGAYLWLTAQPGVDPARFALVGASVGCSVALAYGARDRSVDGVVCLTPGLSYLAIDSATDAKKYGKRPLMLLAGRDERSAAEQLGRLVPGATVEIVPRVSPQKFGLHGTRMFGEVAGIEAKIARFLADAVGKPSDNEVVASLRGKVYYPPDSSGARRLSRKNLRRFSSPVEAEARGYRLPKSRTRSGAGPRDTGASSEPPDEFPDQP